MSTCPACNSTLSEADLEHGECPACGIGLSMDGSVDESMQTMPEVPESAAKDDHADGDQTDGDHDSVDLGNETMAEIPGMESGSEPDQSDSRPGESDSVDEIGQTIVAPRLLGENLQSIASIPQRAIRTIAEIPQQEIQAIADLPQQLIRTIAELPRDAIDVLAASPESASHVLNALSSQAPDDDGVQTVAEIPGSGDSVSADSAGDLGGDETIQIDEAQQRAVTTLMELPQDAIQTLKEIPPAALARLAKFSQETLESLAEVPQAALKTLAELPPESFKMVDGVWAEMAAQQGLQTQAESFDAAAEDSQTMDDSADIARTDGELDEPAGDQTVVLDKPVEESDAGQSEFGQTMALDEPVADGIDQTVVIESGSNDAIDRTISIDSPEADSGQFDSGGMSTDEMKTVMDVFADAIDDSVSPTMTIKLSDSPAGDGGSSLVIKRKLFGMPDDDDTVGAEYELLTTLGEGGMGVVWDARQTSVDRQVALKMLKSKMADKKSEQQKFLAEAVVTGELAHPNIVPIYDVGENEAGALFYSMKKVQGTPWLKAIKKMKFAENIEVLMKVADAIGFAHSRGVVHRDLKPENIMLGEFGEVLVMDWGLAHPTSEFAKRRSINIAHSMGGTPAYMAPEMATGPISKIGPGSDIYLLGGILFEIITGKPPHTGKNTTQCLFAAITNTIRPTDKSGELLDIAYKAMATDPKDRYRTVLDFQAAIREYQSHSESISLSTRAAQDLEEADAAQDYQMFSKATFAFEEALALWAGNAKAAEGLELAKLAHAQTALAKGDYDLGGSLLDPNKPSHSDLFQQITAAKDEVDARHQRLKTIKRIAVALVAMVFVVVTVAFFAVDQQRRIAKANEIEAKENLKEAERQEQLARNNLVEANRQKVKAENARNEAVAAKAKEEQQRIAAVKARDDAVKAEKAALVAKAQEEVQRKAAEKAKETAVLAQKDEEKARVLAEAAERAAVLAKEAEEYEAYIARIGLAAEKIEENSFETALGLLQRCVPEKADERDFRDWEWGRLMHLCGQFEQDFHAPGKLESLAVSDDGKLFATGGENGIVQIWETETGKVLKSLRQAGASLINSVAMSADGKLVAAGGNDPASYITVWNVATGTPLQTKFSGHNGEVLSVAFSKDGQRLLTGSRDRTARLWDVETGRLIQTLSGHTYWVWCAAFSPDEASIVTAGQDGIAIVWNYEVSRGKTINVADDWTDEKKITQMAPFTGHAGPIFSAAFSPDGKSVVTGGYDRRVLIWKPSDTRPYNFKNVDGDEPVAPPAKFRALDGHTASVRSVSFSNDGKLVVSSGHDNTIKVWNAESAKSITSFRGHSSWVRSCAFDPDPKGARWVLSASHDQHVKKWRITNYEEIRVLQGRSLEKHANAVLAARFSADGKTIVTASQDRTAKTWDFATGTQQRDFIEGHEFLTSGAVFFSSGKKLLTSAVDNTVCLWDVATGTEIKKFDRTGRSAALALSHNEKWILTGSDKHDDEPIWKARLWDADGNLIRTFDGHLKEITAVAFAPDDSIVFTGDAKGSCRLWETATGKELQLLKVRGLDRAHSQKVTAAVFLSNDRLLTASNDRVVAAWDVASGTEQTDLIMKHPDAVISMDLSPDGRQLLTSCEDRTIRLWDVQTAKLVGTIKARGSLADLRGNLRREITARRWTVSQLAQASNVDEETIYAIRIGTKPVTAEIAQKLAAGLNLPVTELLRPVTNTVRFSPDGQIVMATNAESRTVQLWDRQNLREIVVPAGDNLVGPFLDFNRIGGLVWSAVFSPDKQNLKVLTVGGDEARLWNVQSRKELMTFTPQGAVASANFSPDGKRIVTASWDNSARIWDATSGHALLKLEGHSGRVNSAVYSPDGKQILTASNDDTVRRWNAATGEVIATLRGHTDDVRSAVFSADGEQILTASNDNSARLWDTATGKQLAQLDGHTAGVRCAAFSFDNKFVVTGSEDTTARIWNLATNQTILVLEGHTASVTSVAFSPDGRRVLTGSEDNFVKLWDTRVPKKSDELADAADGKPAGDQPKPPAEKKPPAADQPAGQAMQIAKAKEILSLTGHTREVTSVCFSPNGKYVLTGSRDGKAILWLAEDWTTIKPANFAVAE